jgi:uncharacterized protein YbjT (DUF2867 family)
MIAVMGATGKVGGAVARRLLDAGEQVRVIGRDEARLADLAAAGAEAMRGDAADAAFLRDGFAGANAVFTMLPFDPSAPDFQAHQARLGEAIVSAVRSSGVRHVVALSSIGADVAQGTGVLTALHAQEQRLCTLDDRNVLLLRPGAFLENLDPAIPALENGDVYADVFASDAPIPMIAIDDLAAVAADALRSRGWVGHVVQELPGPRDVSYAEAVRILGSRLGRPAANYVQLSAAEDMDALAAFGFSPDAARHYVAFAQALATGLVRFARARTAHDRAGMTLEDYASHRAASVRAQPAGVPVAG